MSIDYGIRVIEGFRIKYENVFDETVTESTPCDHVIPIGVYILFDAI